MIIISPNNISTLTQLNSQNSSISPTTTLTRTKHTYSRQKKIFFYLFTHAQCMKKDFSSSFFSTRKFSSCWGRENIGLLYCKLMWKFLNFSEGFGFFLFFVCVDWILRNVIFDAFLIKLSLIGNMMIECSRVLIRRREKLRILWHFHH